MREKEKARIVRIKEKKEKRDAKRKRREEEKRRGPPLRYEKKAQSRTTTTLTRTSQCPTKPALRKSPSVCNSARSRSASPPEKKKLNWAPSNSTPAKDS